MTNKGKAFLFKIYAFLIYLVPMAALFALNYREYDKDGGAVGFWGIVVIAFVVLAFKDYVIAFFKKQPLLTVSLAVFIVSIITAELADQLALISGIAVVASLLSSFVSVISDSFMNHAYIVQPNGERSLNTNEAISTRQAVMEAYGFVFTVKNDKENKE